MLCSALVLYIFYFHIFLLLELSMKDARKYMKMAVDSGLWNAKDPNEFDGDDDDVDDGLAEGEGAI